MKDRCVVGDYLEYFLVRIVVMVVIVAMMIVSSWGPVLPIEVVVLINVAILLFQQYPLEIIILVSWRILTLPITIIVIVVLIIPAAVLIEEVDVAGVFYSEALSVGQLREYLEAVRGGGVVGLHD